PFHTYHNPGTYSISLVAGFDYRGTTCTVVDTDPLVLNFKLNPEARFESDTNFLFPNMPVQFLDSSLNDPAKLTWFFGDGAESSRKNPVRVYREPGTYEVLLIAETAEGCSDTAMKAITIL